MQLIKSIFTASALLSFSVSASLVTLNLTKSDININTVQTDVVSYANGSAWIGKIKYQLYSEALLNYATNDGLYFVSYHQVPTGGQTPYIFPNQTAPVEFTVPHDQYDYPAGSSSAVDFGSDGFLSFNGENKFIGCQLTSEDAALDTWRILWAGQGAPAGVNCTGTLYIQQTGDCETLG